MATHVKTFAPASVWKSSNILYEVYLQEKARDVYPYIPKIYSVDLNNKTATMELINGMVLYDYILEGGYKHLRDLYAQIYDAMTRIHAAGITHGDSHLNNLMISNGRVYVIDFGESFISATKPEEAQRRQIADIGLPAFLMAQLVHQFFNRQLRQNPSIDDMEWYRQNKDTLPVMKEEDIDEDDHITTDDYYIRQLLRS